MNVHTVKRINKDRFEISPENPGLLETAKRIIQNYLLHHSEPTAGFYGTNPKIFVCSAGRFGKAPGDDRPSVLEFVVIPVHSDSPNFAELSGSVASWRPDLIEKSLKELWQPSEARTASSSDSAVVQQTQPYRRYVPPAPKKQKRVVPQTVITSILGIIAAGFAIHDYRQFVRNSQLNSQVSDLRTKYEEAAGRVSSLTSDRDAIVRQLSGLKREQEEKQSQLSEKDNQIKGLEEQIERLNERLKQAVQQDRFSEPPLQDASKEVRFGNPSQSGSLDSSRSLQRNSSAGNERNTGRENSSAYPNR